MKFRYLVFALLCLSAACSPPVRAQVAGYVDLSDHQPLPTSVNGQVLPLKVAIAAVISPKDTVESYTSLLEYLSVRLERPVELVQRRTYLEVNELVAKGEVDLAFVCTSAYVTGHDQFGMELLAAPQVNGDTIYYSFLIVPADSPAQSMEDLRDKVFAFTDPISLSGRMYPTYLVQQLDSHPDDFFARTFFTYSHDDAIEAVANRVADGAAVDSLVYNFAVVRDPELQERTKIIHRSPAFGIPPVVVSAQIRPQLKAELQSLLLEMEENPEGQAVLKAIGVDQFVLIEDQAYAGVRELLSQIHP